MKKQEKACKIAGNFIKSVEIKKVEKGFLPHSFKICFDKKPYRGEIDKAVKCLNLNKFRVVRGEGCLLVR